MFVLVHRIDVNAVLVGRLVVLAIVRGKVRLIDPSLSVLVDFVEVELGAKLLKETHEGGEKVERQKGLQIRRRKENKKRHDAAAAGCLPFFFYYRRQK